jgi:hypothetical protein
MGGTARARFVVHSKGRQLTLAKLLFVTGTLKAVSKTDRTRDLVNLQNGEANLAVETRSVHLPNSLAAELRVNRVSYSSLACLIDADLASDFPMAEP